MKSISKLALTIIIRKKTFIGPYSFFLIFRIGHFGCVRIAKLQHLAKTTLSQMTEIVLPGMVERNRGLIVNVSSASAVRPMIPLYGATKSFVNYFTQALHQEYQHKGVTIQV